MEWKAASKKDDGSIAIPERWLHLHYYEALNILFRMENALRVFVYLVLKNKKGEKWANVDIQISDDENSTIASLAQKRIAQSKVFGYLGYEIQSPLMYLNSGELTRLITSDAYWPDFKKYFKGKKEIIRNKLDEIGTVRNSLAHFRPIKYDDIELIKQNVKHAFTGIEDCFTELFGTINVVPTNSTEQWYNNVKTIGSDLCTVQIYQSKREEWVRVEIAYDCPVLGSRMPWDEYISLRVLKLVTPSILKEFPKLAALCTYLTESQPFGRVDEELETKFTKRISLVFYKTLLKDEYISVVDELKNVILKIEKESDLIQKDNLARGTLIEAASANAQLRKSDNSSRWAVNAASLKCPFTESDPTEYWGSVSLYQGDFIAGSSEFPWMPSDISDDEFPF